MNATPIGVTDNARLLLGYVAGALTRADVYAVESVDAEAGTQVVVNSASGNRYAISVMQLDGVE